MFADRDVSVEVMELMKKLVDELNESIIQVRERISEDELTAYKRAIGTVMGEILIEIKIPIGDRYPELRFWEEP